uniref:Uncharacterized protein n=1 Tax=Kalanchoe fedtschenkoi TaxID=63787 RepID=A0A7N0RAM5_KALFE
MIHVTMLLPAVFRCTQSDAEEVASSAWYAGETYSLRSDYLNPLLPRAMVLLKSS